MSEKYVNVVRTKGGKLRPVCEFCGTVGRAADPDSRGRLSIFSVSRGWSEAPYSEGFVHPDGSTGSRWTCPACNARMDRGEALRERGGEGTWQRFL